MAALKKKPATRSRIEKAALALFARRGYAATSVDAVAERAAVSHGAVLWHFHSKANLYREVVEGVGDRFVGAMREYVDGGPHSVSEAVGSCMELALSDPDLVGLLADLAGNRNDPEVERAARRFNKRLLGFWGCFLGRNGGCRTPERIALLIVALQAGLATTRVEGPHARVPVTAFAALIESLATGDALRAS